MAGKRWTEDELSFMRDNAKTLTSAECARRLGRTLPSVHHAAIKRGINFKLQGTDGRKGWSGGEVMELLGLAETHSLISAAKKLNRSVASVAHTASRRKISFKKHRMTNKQVADIIGINKEYIRRIRDDLGLQFRRNRRTSDSSTGSKGPTGNDIVLIAKKLLSNPGSYTQDKHNVLPGHLRQVIADWEGYE